MRTAIRAATVVVGVGFLAASTAMAGDRTRVRDLKGASMTLHLASSQPESGMQRMTLPDGSTVYVSPRPTWTSVDVLAATGRDGTVDLQLSGDASSRMRSLLSRSGNARVAVVVGGSVVASAGAAPNGILRIEGLSPENSDRITRSIRSEQTPVAGPLLTVVPAGEIDGLHLVDVYVQGATDLRSYQVSLLTGGGESGRLELENVAIDNTRPEYVFANSEIVPATSSINGRLAAVRTDGGTDAMQPAYLGTFAFRPTADASGAFRVTVHLGRDTILGNGLNEEIGYSTGPDARILVGSLQKSGRK